MKKRIGMRIFMAAVAIMMAFGAQANEIPKMLEDNNTWIYRVRPTYANPDESAVYNIDGYKIAEVVGDTIVGEHKMKRIKVTEMTVTGHTGGHQQRPLYYAAMEKDSMIYLHAYFSGGTPYPIMKYNVEEGDVVFDFPNNAKLRVDKVGTIHPVGRERTFRVISVMMSYDSYSNPYESLKFANHWIEGIGATTLDFITNNKPGCNGLPEPNTRTAELVAFYRGAVGALPVRLEYEKEDLRPYLDSYYRDNHRFMPSFEPGKSWVTTLYQKCLHSDHPGVNHHELYDVRHTYAGDTIVAGVKMKKLLRTVEFNYGPYAGPVRDNIIEYVGYEQGGQVYANNSMMMDFGHTEGDNIFTGSGHLKVVNDELVNVRGYDRRIMTIESGNQKFYWIEGIYTTNLNGFKKISEPSYMQYDKFKACYLNDELIFSAEDLEEYKKTQQSGIEEILPAESETGDEANPDAHNPAAPVYDLQGHRVTRQVPGQVYVSQGRKWVQR